MRPRLSLSKLQLPGGSGVPPALLGLCWLQLVAAGGGIGGLQGDGRRSGHLRRGGGSAPYCVAARAELCCAEQIWWPSRQEQLPRVLSELGTNWKSES